MITAALARIEARPRDVKRRRIILRIGNEIWHLDKREAMNLKARLETAIRRATRAA